MIPLILYSLATWRIASLLCNEDGPGDVFKNMRASLHSSPFFPDLLSCVWCTSVWVGALWAWLDWIIPDLAIRFAMLFSFSAVAVIIQRWFEITEGG